MNFMASASTDPPKILWSVRDLSKRTGLSERTISRLTAPNGDLKCARVGRRCLYDPIDVQAFLESLKVESTDEVRD